MALGSHLAESLLSTGKKSYLSGKVLRLDSLEGDEGLQVMDIGPITEWTNMTGMEGGQENIILGTRFGGKDIEFNLLKPCDEYLDMFRNTYRMVFMANSIITTLIDCNEKGMFMEYAELLEFIDKLDPPVLYGEILPRCDEEFLQLHSDFIVSQVSSFEDAGDVEEDLTILGMPCIKYIVHIQHGRSGQGCHQKICQEGRNDWKHTTARDTSKLLPHHWWQNYSSPPSRSR